MTPQAVLAQSFTLPNGVETFFQAEGGAVPRQPRSAAMALSRAFSTLISPNAIRMCGRLSERR